MKTSIALPLLMLTAAAANSAPASGDYPTAALADYVLGCMRSNGETRDMLERCSCSIDVIASIVPYERYVQAYGANDRRSQRAVSGKRPRKGCRHRTPSRTGRSRRALLLAPSAANSIRFLLDSLIVREP